MNYHFYINSAQWKAKSRNCQKLSGNWCILFPWLRSRDCHHMTYRNMGGEIPVRDTVPLSKTAHWLVHLPVLWRIGNKVSPVRVLVNYVLRSLFLFWIILSFFTRGEIWHNGSQKKLT